MYFKLNICNIFYMYWAIYLLLLYLCDIMQYLECLVEIFSLTSYFIY